MCFLVDDHIDYTIERTTYLGLEINLEKYGHPCQVKGSKPGVAKFHNKNLSNEVRGLVAMLKKLSS
jgi:hypothetical protein